MCRRGQVPRAAASDRRRWDEPEEGSVEDSKPRRGRRRKPPPSNVVRTLAPGEKPTLRTIAEMTGLAITTISRALNNAPELAQETRERVQRIAAQIGYVPDRTALRLKTG